MASSPKQPEIKLWQIKLPDREGMPHQLRSETGELSTLVDSKDLNDLSQEELNRAIRYRSIPALQDFVTVRASLRRILAAELSTNPSEIRFEILPEGKPILTKQHGSLHFNVSHTSGLAMIAISRELELGIDVENTFRQTDLIPLARRYFAPSETEQLMDLDPDAQRSGFFRIWTSKEAYIKARAKGLGIPLDRFSIRVSEPHPILNSTEHDPGAESRWTLQSVSVPSPHMATLCYHDSPESNPKITATSSR